MLIRNLIVAFSLYSKIPMPQFAWKEEDMKYNLVFLPFVGLFTGGLLYLCFLLVTKLGLSSIFSVALFSAVPLLVTGGFHLDGFMDTQDALKSYKPGEEKLKILEDPHIGAFSVISLLTFAVLWAGGLLLICERMSERRMLMFGGCFVLSRVLTGISSLVMKKAKDTGMLNSETKSAGKGGITALFIELMLVLLVMAVVDRLVTAGYVAVMFLFFLYYRDKTKKEFGGATGDTAGYFLCMSELIMVMVLAGCSIIRP